ncbi:hypothetical protein [Subtercola sp. YIM 133946]|uniref:hypothetical protein n=1 Tax=Subtercola sp. YIM 133946 TaxID=3118909 RepID=UPI002F95BA9F
MIECVVDDCTGDPVERLTVDANGLLLVYAICRDHALQVRDGFTVAQPADSSRGLIGPRSTPLA